MRRVLFLVVAAVLLALAPCVADEGHLGAAGGSLKLMDGHPSIRMVSEYVHLKIRKDRVDVYCKFVFRNEGKATTVRMGFPEQHIYDTDRFEYFRSTVDGKPVQVKRVLKGKPARYDYGPHYNWWVKSVSFAAGQTRVVEDRYGGPIGLDYSNWMTSSYVLVTGKSWHGPIGRAVITADISAIRQYQTIIPSPVGYQKRGDHITWVFRNFEPKDDIGIELCPNYGRIIVDGQTDVGFGLCVTNDPVRAPTVENGILMVWTQDLPEVLSGADVTNSNMQCTVKYGGKTLRLKAGSSTADLDGRKIFLPKAPRTETDGYRAGMMVPLEPIVRAFGFKYTRVNDKTYINSPSVGRR